MTAAGSAPSMAASSSRTISPLMRCQGWRIVVRAGRAARAAEESSNPPTATSSGTWRPALSDYVTGGGTLLVGCFSGIVDAWDRVHPGGYPGALRDSGAGITVEEWLPLREGERATLSWEEGTATGGADTWTQAVRLAGAKPVAWYADGPAASGPAVTRHDLGEGRAWYVSARTDRRTTAALLAVACEAAGIEPGITTPVRPAEGAAWPRDLEVTRRADNENRFVTLINHGEDDAAVRLDGQVVIVPPGEVRIIIGRHPVTPEPRGN